GWRQTAFVATAGAVTDATASSADVTEPLMICWLPTESAARLVAVTHPTVSFGLVTAPSASLGVVTAPAARSTVCTPESASSREPTGPGARLSPGIDPG